MKKLKLFPFFFLLLIFFNGLAKISAQSIKIGSQEWTTTNLDVSTFRNGETIPEVKTDAEWKAAGEKEQPAWCYYNNDPENGKKYGKLYNFYAVIDPRGLAPEGWHVPTNLEWGILTDFVGGNAVAGKKLKTKEGWESGISGTNESGFSALPGGFHSMYGGFDNLGTYGCWWSCTETDEYYALVQILYHDTSHSNLPFQSKGGGYSVRCLKN